jgi:hypothetical protein
MKGFPRKYNLFEHMKRCHPTFTAGSREQRTIRGEKLGENEGQVGESGDVVMRTGSGRMTEELERLCAIREEADGNIRALKRALSILGDGGS